VTLSLAFDHRLVDGQAAALFLRDVGDVVADPTNLIAWG
jgi:2-oxoisovalerate dehydrogenase E2 component (dihydrolipoyl transacylase)